MSSAETPYVPGLAGIPAARSAVSYIDGEAGVLEYRGFGIETLAERSTFEETAWLLLHGTLPTRAELQGFEAQLAEHRALPASVLEAIAHLPRDGHPMAALQAGLAALGMASAEVDLKGDASGLDAIARILATTPSIVAAFERARAGAEPLSPRAGLSTAANFLWMTTGEEPDELAARALDVALILHADHTMNASTFAARVVASTEADPYTVCASAVGALKGPLHGGANERVLRQLAAIGAPGNVPGWMDRTQAEKGKVMGFGHRVYKTKDPRAYLLQRLVVQVFEKLGRTPTYDTALALEKVVEERLGERGIYPNVDFFSGILYAKLGIPTDQFTPIFAISRVAGWLAHWREQMVDNKIFRPRQVFTGGHGAEYVELDAR